MRTRCTLVGGIVAILVALVVAFPTPAAADEKTFRDRLGDTTHPADIGWVHVKHAGRIVVAVHHDNLTFSDGPGRIRIAYNTGSRYPGPEFYLRLDYQSDQRPELRAAQGWGHLHSPPTRCQHERARVRPGADRTRISVPRSCFGNPSRVRVQVRVAPFSDDDRRVDLAPGPRAMGPWVAR